MDFKKHIELFKNDSKYYGDKNFITSSQLGKLSHSPAKLVMLLLTRGQQGEARHGKNLNKRMRVKQ